MSASLDSELPSSYTPISFSPILLATCHANPASDPCDFLPWLWHICFKVDHNNCILSFSNATKTLEIWHYNQCIPSDALLGHHQIHCVLRPGCLCSSQSIHGNFSKALVFMVTSGQHAGQCVAACAAQQCKYWIFLEKLYSKPSLPVKGYPQRGKPLFPPTEPNTPASSPLNLTGTVTTGLTLALLVLKTPAGQVGPYGPTLWVSPKAGKPAGKRKRAEVKFDPFVVTPTPKCTQPVQLSPFTLLMKLDSFFKPGLMMKQLKALLTWCECGLIMTKWVYEVHECMLDSNCEVIDLTLEELDTV
ncbi:hypothetical protein V8B97DRAFT_2024582 [Scleroderma yunnanense]